MNESQGVGILLSEDLLTQVHGGMNQPNPRPDYRLDPKAMGGVMAAGAVTGALGGAAIGGIGTVPGAAGGALMAGAGYCIERLVNPPMVQVSPPLMAVCHGSGSRPMPMAVCHGPAPLPMLPSHGRR
jgi:hypothetical protein